MTINGLIANNIRQKKLDRTLNHTKFISESV
jgi:hypothetical protein